jgi:hypothetical protein
MVHVTFIIAHLCLLVVLCLCLYRVNGDSGATERNYPEATEFRARMQSEWEPSTEEEEVSGNDVTARGRPELTAAEAAMLDRKWLYLNVGGILPADHWINVNAQVSTRTCRLTWLRVLTMIPLYLICTTMF